MAASGHAPTATEYIVHHLTHLATGKQKSIIDFSVFNVDTIFFSVAIMCLTLLLLWLAARKASAGVPGRFQAAVESLVVWGYRDLVWLAMIAAVIVTLKSYFIALIWR